MRGDLIVQRVERMIANSPLTLTVHYPPNAPAPSSTTVAGRPASPLTGTLKAETVLTPAAAPSQPPVTMQCLWYDLLYVAASRGKAIETVLALVPGAQVLARVRVADAALDPDTPAGKNVFEASDHVEHLGARYRVLDVRPVAAGILPPHTYYVWLTGAPRQ
jgi:hypothetical protein